MVGVPFPTAQEVGEIEETLWLGFNRHSHDIFKLRHVAPYDRDPILQTGERRPPWVNIHADDIFAPRDQTPDNSWTDKSRATDD
jgi:hypothetical protein